MPPGIGFDPFQLYSPANVTVADNEFESVLGHTLATVPPIVFICHSLGDIVLKTALMVAGDQRRVVSRCNLRGGDEYCGGLMKLSISTLQRWVLGHPDHQYLAHWARFGGQQVRKCLGKPYPHALGFQYHEHAPPSAHTDAGNLHDLDVQIGTTPHSVFYQNPRHSSSSIITHLGSKRLAQPNADQARSSWQSQDAIQAKQRLGPFDDRKKLDEEMSITKMLIAVYDQLARCCLSMCNSPADASPPARERQIGDLNKARDFARRSEKLVANQVDRFRPSGLGLGYASVPRFRRELKLLEDELSTLQASGHRGVEGLLTSIKMIERANTSLESRGWLLAHDGLVCSRMGLRACDRLGTK
ncbi:hypothetical protein B0T26DRAFT_679306 [Lasiosphaeria miniovina]|uniref:Uncharacterized protein n=1 Tax=Lasiosphaeria miniovina TaxID=1954250 RepID=A0AA40A646_9PEZI|nr:uncharacterized protein B0T26DRAFT_679306 [Lasiosphaeria miniovina]KAK0709964.1 hypothetical protein B0T26DRAFT_679306 [Lasiosphaeria miniovina]